MRGLISYILAAVVVALAIAVIAPSASIGLSVMARPVDPENVMRQVVNRAQKSDRLPITSGARPVPPAAKPAMMDGCEPVFSALSVHARANYPGRCVA